MADSPTRPAEHAVVVAAVAVAAEPQIMCRTASRRTSTRSPSTSMRSSYVPSIRSQDTFLRPMQTTRKCMTFFLTKPLMRCCLYPSCPTCSGIYCATTP